MTISSLSQNAYSSQTSRLEEQPSRVPSTSRSGLSTAQAADAAVNVTNLEIKEANKALATRQLGISEEYDIDGTTLIGTRLNALA